VVDKGAIGMTVGGIEERACFSARSEPLVLLVMVRNERSGANDRTTGKCRIGVELIRRENMQYGGDRGCVSSLYLVGP
jgi:hypothetical protein